MKLLRFLSSPLMVNTLLLFNESTGSAVVIDPGDRDVAKELADEVLCRELKVEFILNTHEHPDHTGGNSAVKALFPSASLAMHKEASRHLSYWSKGELAEMLDAEPSPEPDSLLSGGSVLNLKGFSITVIHTPGHSPGSVVYHLPEYSLAVVGDLIFKGSVGRYDLPMSNLYQMRDSIQKLLDILPPETVLVPGHGEVTDVATELKENPYILEFLR